MEAKDFINKGIECGDKVKVTIGATTHEGFFGGYKCFEGTHSCLEYALYPVFYAVGKEGQMVRRSMIPGRSCSWGMHDIKDIEKVVVPYRHVGYYNNPDDCPELALRGHKVALNYWKAGKGCFHAVDNDEVFKDIADDGDTRILDNGRYAVRISDCGMWDGDPGNYPGYIDIFERIGQDDAAFETQTTKMDS